MATRHGVDGRPAAAVATVRVAMLMHVLECSCGSNYVLFFLTASFSARKAIFSIILDLRPNFRWWKYAPPFLVDFLYTTGPIFRLKPSKKAPFLSETAPAQLQLLRAPMTNTCNSGLEHVQN